MQITWEKKWLSVHLVCRAAPEKQANTFQFLYAHFIQQFTWNLFFLQRRPGTPRGERNSPRVTSFLNKLTRSHPNLLDTARNSTRTDPGDFPRPKKNTPTRPQQVLSRLCCCVIRLFLRFTSKRRFFLISRLFCELRARFAAPERGKTSPVLL